jgi:hypothetical protein
MKWAVLILGCGLMAGCAYNNMPQARNFPPTQQKIAVAAQHWGMIATDAVQQTQIALLEQQNAVKGMPVYVADNTSSEFNKAFRNFMISGLVNAGVAVSAKKEGAIELAYETQVIKHHPRGEAFNPASNGYQPGALTGGVAGFWVLRNALEKWSTSSAAVGTIAAAGAYDAYRFDHPLQTGVELLLTTSIVHKDRYLMRNTDAYYVEDADISLFDPCKGKSRRNCR